MKKKWFRRFFFIFSPWIALVYRLRRKGYLYGTKQSFALPVPVISIGSLFMGGAGKTPITLWVAKLLEDAGFRVMILTRGHKGSLSKTHGRLWGGEENRLRADPDLYGDEPAMMAPYLSSKSAVVVGKRRLANFFRYEKEVSPDYVLLDDGFQHLKIRRKLDLLLFDALLPLSEYKIFPEGQLREGTSALEHLTGEEGAVVITRANLASEERLVSLKEFIHSRTGRSLPIFFTGYYPTNLYDQYRQPFPHPVQNMRVVAMAGTAGSSAQAFFKMLEQMGMVLVDKVILPDHFAFKGKRLRSIFRRAKLLDLKIVTTEKDIVKINKQFIDERILFLGIEIRALTRENERELISLIKCRGTWEKSGGFRF